jgi:Transglycosylase SLT domain
MAFNPLSILTGITSAGSSGGNPVTAPQSSDDSQGALPSGDLYAKSAPSGKGGINYGMIAYDPEQSSRVLTELEKYRDSRAQMSPWDEHLQKAIAYGATYPGGQGISQLKTIQDQKQADQKAAFDMQMEIENFKAAQRQQQIFNQMKMQSLFGGAGGTGGAGAGTSNVSTMAMPLEIRNALLNTRSKEEWDKIYNAYAEDINKFQQNPAAYKQDDFYNRETGKKEKYTPWQIQHGQPQIDAERSQIGDPNANVPVSSKSTLRNPNFNTVAALSDAVLGQESSYGKADTSKPNIQGAVGPGQILPTTFAQYQKEGVIPKDWDVNNPEHNKVASSLLLSHYYDKYNGDVDKTLAAYHGGEGAVRSDGTINLAAKDALGVTNQQYIDGVKQKAGFANVPPTKVAGPAQPMSYGDFEVRQKALEEKLTKEAGKEGEEIGNRKNAMQTAYGSADESLANIHDINNLAITHPKVFGVLQHPTVLSAVGEMLKSGIQDGAIGSHHISSIEEAIKRVAPGMSEADLTAAQEAVQKLAQLELSASKTYLKGQGAVSDNERLLISRLTGNISNSPQALHDIMAWNEARTNFDKAIGTAHDKWEDSHPNESYRNFEKTDEYKAIKNSYKQQVDALAAKAGKYPGAPGTSNLAPPKPPPGYDPNWRSKVKGFFGGNE